MELYEIYAVNVTDYKLEHSLGWTAKYASPQLKQTHLRILHGSTVPFFPMNQPWWSMENMCYFHQKTNSYTYIIFNKRILVSIYAWWDILWWHHTSWRWSVTMNPQLRQVSFIIFGKHINLTNNFRAHVCLSVYLFNI